jgi:hypothetical protein
MAEVNQDLVQQLEQNRASFERAGAAFDEDVKLIDAKLAEARGGEASAPDDEDAAEDFGTGRYEERTVAQLKALAESKGLPTSGNKEDLIETLREG